MSSDPLAILPANYMFQPSDNGTHTFTVTLKTNGTQTVIAQDTGNSLLDTTSSAISVGTVSLAAAKFASVPLGNFRGGDRLWPDAYGAGCQRPSGHGIYRNRPLYHQRSQGPGAGQLHIYRRGRWRAYLHERRDIENGGKPNSQCRRHGDQLNRGQFCPAREPSRCQPIFPWHSGKRGRGHGHKHHRERLDPYGNQATGYGGTVHFKSSDPTAIVPANYTFQPSDNGTHTFTVTLKTSGNQTVTVGDTGNSLLSTTSSAISVSAASMTAVKFTLVSSGPFVAGSAFGVTITALDVNGHVVTGYTGTVHFTTSDPKGLVPANYTFTAADGGVHTFANAVTLKTAGNQTVSAADTVTNSIAGSVALLVSPAVASQFSLSAPASAFVGTAISITVSALDPYGNQATGYRGTVHFTSNDWFAKLASNYTFTAADAGVHAFLGITFARRGTDSLTVTDTTISSIKGTVNISVSRGGGANIVVGTGTDLPVATSPVMMPAGVVVASEAPNGVTRRTSKDNSRLTGTLGLDELSGDGQDLLDAFFAELKAL